MTAGSPTRRQRQSKHKRGDFKQIAPGHRQAALPMLDPGEYRLDITEDRKNRQIAYPPVGFTSSYNPNSELPRPTSICLCSPNRLEQVAEKSIPIQPDPGKIQYHAYLPAIWAMLVSLASMLFLMEVAIGRLLLGEASEPLIPSLSSRALG